MLSGAALRGSERYVCAWWRQNDEPAQSNDARHDGWQILERTSNRGLKNIKLELLPKYFHFLSEIFLTSPSQIEHQPSIHEIYSPVIAKAAADYVLDIGFHTPFADMRNPKGKRIGLHTPHLIHSPSKHHITPIDISTLITCAKDTRHES